MAVLSDAERVNAWADFQRSESTDGHAINANKADLRAAINAADDWVVSSQSAFNTALPLPARTALTTAQKARLLVFVLERRYLSGA